MPRFLWLGLLACAIVLGVLLLLRATGDAGATGPDAIAHDGATERRVADLVAPSDEVPVERTAVVEPLVVLDGASVPKLAGYEIQSLDDSFQSNARVDVVVRVVRDVDGSPIEGASVSYSSVWRGGPALTTDASGLVTLAGVELGRALEVSAVGFLDTRQVLTTRPDPHTNPIEVRLTKVRNVVVRCLGPRGAPFRPEDWQLPVEENARFGLALAGACASPGLAFESGGAPVYRAVRDEAVEGLQWNVEVRGQGPACAQVVLAGLVVGVAPLDAAATELDVLLDAHALEACLAEVDVLVLDEDGGKPIAGASVDTGSGYDPTDAEGKLHVKAAIGASLGLRVRAKGYVRMSTVVERPLPRPILVRLRVGRSIRGRLVEETGPAAAGVDVRLLTQEVDGRGASSAPPMFRSGADGAFEFVDLERGKYTLVIRGPRPGAPAGESPYSARELAVDCTSADVDGITMRVQRIVVGTKD